MISLRLVVLFSVLASAYSHTRGAVPVDENAEDISAGLAHHQAVTRRLMKDKKKNLTGGNSNSDKKGGGKNDRNPGGGGGGGGGGGDGSAVAEQHQCVPFNDQMQARASLSLTDDACKTNSCGGGCCRVYHWLICDTNDEMPQLACVCNGNTKPLPTTAAPVPAITSVPVTPMPTPLATPAVTSDIKDGDGLSTPPTTSAPVPANPAPVPAPVTTPATNPGGQTTPPYTGGAPADSCASGSPHHNNPLFRDFTRCFGSGDCPLATECCIHSFCFCGEPDTWDGDCVAPTTDTSK